MSFCRNCGNEMPEGMNFCPNCGTSVKITGVKVRPADEPRTAYASEYTTGTSAYTEKTSEYTKDASGYKEDTYKYTDDTSEYNERHHRVNRVSENNISGFDKYGKFYGILLLIIALVDLKSDPAVLTILLSAAIIAGCIFCLSRKYKLKGFTIAALVIAVICLLCGIGQAKTLGLFSSTNDSQEIEEAADDDAADTIIVEKKESTEEETLPDDENEEKVSETESSTAESSETESPEASEETAQNDEENTSDGVDPDLKAYLDSYEAFMDEYVDFMKNYSSNSGNAIAMLSEYTEIMEKYQDFAEKIDAYDTDTMSDADLKYYLDVTTRCTEKMLDAY